jgi:hypothetical protein
VLRLLALGTMLFNLGVRKSSGKSTELQQTICRLGTTAEGLTEGLMNRCNIGDGYIGWYPVMQVCAGDGHTINAFSLNPPNNL